MDPQISKMRFVRDCEKYVVPTRFFWKLSNFTLLFAIGNVSISPKKKKKKKRKMNLPQGPLDLTRE